MSEPVIELAGVDKAYRFFRLTGLNLQLEAGQVMGLVGPNGAGKSTTLRILMGMVRPDRGVVRVLGRLMPECEAEIKRDVGFMSDDMRLYGSETLAWHMRFVAAVHPDWDARYGALLQERFLLHADQPIRSMSHGERVKATLLLALARRPRLLLLDEPTTGLDPVARHEVLTELMDVVRDERRSILFSSHNTHDVERISDQIAFLDRGRIIECRDKESFLDSWRRLQLDVAPGTTLPAIPGVVESVTSGRLAVITTRAYTPGLETLFTGAGITVREVQRMTLEEIFVAGVMHDRRERAA
ncbi:MAG TPA: ABC transporter ATP-binding protein [Vicinamibacterales bacterium]